MSSSRKDPIIIQPITPPSDPSKGAAFVFVHGLGDEAEGVENIARQFQSASKLPYMTWVIPNALENHDLAATAWYMPTHLSPYPPSRSELEDDEDEEGMMATVAYLTSLIDNLVQQGIPEKRIVLGGFSQGHAMSLLTGLVSKYSGKLAGLAGLSGYLPLSERIPVLREEAGLSKEIPEDIEIFLARGTGDRLVPKRHHRLCHERLVELGVKEERLVLKEYEGMGHVMSGAELRDLCEWLERIVPA
ncbi:acyl-protein thioesterase 1 [Paraphoma chrysanthemicola]|nr:acyl-protein thioesterase 1 [Paraphoma chrysanthemicola]